MSTNYRRTRSRMFARKIEISSSYSINNYFQINIPIFSRESKNK